MAKLANPRVRGCLGAVLAALLAMASSAGAADSGFLGMNVQGMSPATAAALGRKSADGVLVRDVALGGPADKAGVKRGDLIVKFAGRKIDSFESMVKAAGATRPGEEAKIELLREGKPVTLAMRLGQWTDAWRVGAGAVANHPASGLTLASLTSKLRDGFNLRWGTLGVLVTLVDPNRTDIGLRRGDVIAQVNQVAVWKPDQVIAAYDDAKAAGRKELLLLIERVDGFHYMLLPVR